SVNDETCFTNTNWHKEPGFNNPKIVTTSVNGAFGPFSGSQMCHGFYNVLSGTGASGTFADRAFGTSVSEVWGRYMFRVTGPNGVGTFAYSFISTKVFQLMNEANLGTV